MPLLQLPELNALARKNVSPFFVLSPAVVKKNAVAFKEAAKKAGKRVRICYSVKSNPHPKIFAVLEKEGVGMELVSLRELHAVSSFAGTKIFNSPASSEEELREALKQKCLIIIDNLSQAQLLHSLSKGKSLEVGIRVGMDKHRFGFAPKEIKAGMKELEKMGFVVVALHAHAGTNQSLQDYRQFLTRVHALLLDFPRLKILDLGGGFPGNETLRSRNASLAEYMALIPEVLGETIDGIELAFEVGRNLVEDSMFLFTRVQHIKVVNDTPYALMDTGINVLSKLTMCPLRFIPLQDSIPGKKENYVLCGPSMFGSDEFGRYFGKLERGDLICVENVGAYCTEIAWTLSRDVPPIIVIEK